jgi:sugar phosphate isomerase/epimerase
MKAEGMMDFKISVEMLGPYLAHVHAKNCAWIAPCKYREDGSTVWELAWVPIERGMVEWDDVVQCLRSVGYDEWISFEDFSDIPTEMKLQNNIQYIKGKLE